MPTKPPTPSPVEAFLPEKRTISALREAAAGCTGCDLYKNATQTVFGEGSSRARVILVGEQPGDSEDLEGHPFIGPAGRVLDGLLEQAGIDRRTVYVTNAVKHFKWTPRGKRRLHQKPTWSEIKICHAWLDAELEAIRPEVVVALGATAAQSFLGRDFKITARRGELIEAPFARRFLATWHPSAILRMPEKEARDRARAEMIADFRTVAAALHERARLAG